MESDENIIRLLPADFAVELVVQQAGVVMLEEDVECGIAGNGPLNLRGLEQVQCCVRQCHEGHIGLALHTFLVASYESEGQAVRNIDVGLQFLVRLHHPFYLHCNQICGFPRANCCIFISWQIIAKPVRFFPPFLLFTFCRLVRFLVEDVPSGFAFVTRHILRTSFSIRSSTPFGCSFESNGMIRWVNTANMAKAEASAVFETSSTSHWAIVSRLSMYHDA